MTLRMAKERKGYASDVSDEEWAFCAPYLTLMKEGAPQREHSLRALQWTALVCACGLSVANDAQRPAAVARGATANSTLVAGGMF